MPGAAQDTLREVSDTINEVVSVAGMIQDPVGAVTGMLEDKADQVLANATNFISQALPSFPAAFLGSLAIGMPHAHVLHPPSGPPPVPPTPLPPIGMVALGTCVSVMINGIPAARSGDVGFNPTCCGIPPMFEVFTGSSKVFIGGKRAARMVDITMHCKPGAGGAAAASGGVLSTLGKVATAAAVGADVMDAVEGDPAAAARLAVMAAQAAADAVANALKASMGMDACVPPGTMGMVMLGAPNVLIGGFPMPSWSAIAGGFMKLLKGLKRRKKGSDGKGKSGCP